MSTLASPKIQYLPSGGIISTAMVFSTKDYQNSANSTYTHVSSFNAVSRRPYTFKTDRERMLYKVGQLANVPGATGY